MADFAFAAIALATLAALLWIKLLYVIILMPSITFVEIHMEAVNPNDNALSSGNMRPANERIATLEERSQHAATKAELHRAMLMLFVALLTTLGGLIIHLHNTSQTDIAELRLLLIDIVQRLPGG